MVSSETPLIALASPANQPFGFSVSVRLIEREEDLLLLGARLVEEGGVALLGAQPEMDEHASRRRRRRGSCSACRRHAHSNSLRGEVPVLLQALALEANTGMPAAAMAAAAWSWVE